MIAIVVEEEAYAKVKEKETKDASEVNILTLYPIIFAVLRDFLLD